MIVKHVSLGAISFMPMRMASSYGMVGVKSGVEYLIQEVSIHDTFNTFDSVVVNSTDDVASRHFF
jgi:hypothetical protein